MSTAKKLLLEGVSDAAGFIGGALAGYWLGQAAGCEAPAAPRKPASAAPT